MGRADGEYMMPLELLHTLTGAERMELHVEMREGSETAFAKYGTFSVGSRVEKFVLSVGEYDGSSSAGDSLLYHNGGKWSTQDEDNDIWSRSCAQTFRGSYWFKRCHKSNPLGEYGNDAYAKGISWRSFRGYYTSLDYIEYLVRPNPCLSGASKACSACSPGSYICALPQGGVGCCSAPLDSCEQATDSGPHHILLRERAVLVHCDVDTGGGGWTTALSRKDGSVDFESPGWDTFAHSGVGNPSGEFFLSLDDLHALTSEGEMELLVQMSNGSDSAFAYYGSFSVDDEANKYRLSVGLFDSASTAGDSLSYHDGMLFSTRDQDNDLSPPSNCASVYKAAFWFVSCYSTSPLGKYGAKDSTGIIYSAW